MSGKEWDCLEKNYTLKRNKKVLMIILCVVEAIVSLLFISGIGHGMLNSQMFHQLGVYVIQPFEYPKMLFSLGFRLFITLVSCVVIIILSMVSLITKCLIQYYSYYSTNQKHPIRHGILRLSLKIIVISILGSVVQLMILQRIIVFLLYSHEVIRNIVLMRKLSRLLYQRYFDARFHEYHHSSVVAYYKRSYFEFKIASFFYILFRCSFILFLVTLNPFIQ